MAIKLHVKATSTPTGPRSSARDGSSGTTNRREDGPDTKFAIKLFLVAIVLTQIFTSANQVYPNYTTVNSDCDGMQPMTARSTDGNSSNLTTTSANTSSASLALSTTPEITPTIELEDLVHTTNRKVIHCDGSLTPIESTILPESITHPPNRKIPKIVHMTSKSRCMTQGFIVNINKWRLPDYSLYIHDDDAMDRLLLEKYWPEFPMLRLIERCIVSRAAKSDLWRLLVLWEYGGIYTDIDNAPGDSFEDGDIIQDDDDAWFLKEAGNGFLSQWFMASSPKHPFLHIAITHVIVRLLSMVDDIQNQYTPYITGPGLTKASMVIFMNNNDTYGHPPEGKFVGVGNRSMTVVGGPHKTFLYVQRESVSGKDKNKQYKAMGMTHFSFLKGRDRNNAEKHYSCHERLYYDALSKG